MNRFLQHTILFLIVLWVFVGCSTEKNTRATRTFHNINSKYNIYFNAGESVKKGVATIDERIDDDFTRILPVYKSSVPSAGEMVKSDMETAIIKCSKLIEIHSITKKPKRKPGGGSRKYQEFASQEEFNKWIDDSYLLMGKAYFYQHNFVGAIDNFGFLVRKYPKEETADEAQVWLIRCYTELERFAEASEVIQAVQADENFPKKFEKELAIATADYYIRQQEYTEAIKFLDIAINKILLKRNKARLKYIEAQLYQELGMTAEASAAFSAVARMNPDYRMAFNAKINAAGIFSGVGDTEKLKKELNKMLRDNKNFDFRDQIYFALGNLYFNEGNRPVAIDNYTQSVATSFQNQYQRALSAITLAGIYFEDLEYRKAQSYYDSAMIIIDETYPDYNTVAANYKGLTNLVDNLVTVEREDSLQRIVRMPDMERESFIARLMKEEQERQRNEENLALQGAGDPSLARTNRNRLGMGSQSSGAGWYFYNPQTVSYGRVTFQQLWGKRKLEDNWNRSNKGINTEMSDDNGEGIDSTQIVIRENDPLKKEFYLQDLPLTDSLMTISHDNIRDALYNSGKIFKTEFNNYPRSAGSFEDLIKRYPDNIYLLPAMFELYDLYELMGNKEKSDFYRNEIITRFPESNYAQYLINPNFFIEMQVRLDSLNRIYDETFRSYKSGNYRKVIALASQMKAMKPDSNMVTKIDFMEAVANGTQTDMGTFKNNLQNYISVYPKAEPAPLAGEILKLIEDSTLTDIQKLIDMGYISEDIKNEELLPQNQNADDEFGGKFTYDEDLLHYFVIAYPRSQKIDMNRLNFDIANYNIDHYTKVDYDIEAEPLNDDLAFVVVRSMENKEAALIYHGAIIRKASVFKALNDVDYLNFVISSTNYRAVMNEKSLTDYLKFFVKNYSRFIKSNFTEDDTEVSPEELMARAKEQDNLLKERGQFVVVSTGAEKLFNTKIDTTQNFVIAIQDKGLSTRQILNDFSEFNRDEFRAWNLALQLKETENYRLLVVNGIPTLNESMSYFRKVVVTRKLFNSLGQATYRNFLITNENLQKLVEQNKVDEYLDFFRSNYIQRAPATGGAAATQTGNTQTAAVQSQTNAANTDVQPEEYKGAYNKNIEDRQYFVFVIPTLGIDQPAFIKGIEDYNLAGFANLNLKVDVIPLDDIRQIVRITGLPDVKTARDYFSKTTNNRDLYTPLRGGNYRNFLVTEPNFVIFLKEKNIVEYMDFYKRLYLGQ